MTSEEQLEQIDQFMSHVRWLVTVVSSLVVITIGSAGFLGVSSIRELSSQISTEASTSVRIAIEQDGQNLRSISKLREELEKNISALQSHQDTLDKLNLIGSVDSPDAKDATFLFYSLVSLTPNRTDPVARATALKLLDAIIALAETGQADPNTVFNAATEAAERGYDLSALKLSTLAFSRLPTPSHEASMAEQQNVLGRAFELKNDKLVEIAASSESIRAESWATLIRLVQNRRREESEHVLSDAENTAQRNRSRGYLGELIEAIENTVSDRSTSYAFVTLAKLHAMRGDPDWRREFDSTIDDAFRRLASESPMSTWFRPSIEGLNEIGDRLALSEEIERAAERRGVDLQSLTQSLAAASQNDVSQILDRLGNLGTLRRPTEFGLSDCARAQSARAIDFSTISQQGLLVDTSQTQNIIELTGLPQNRIQINLAALDAGVDPAMYAFSLEASGTCDLIASNDDFGGTLDSMITLDASGGRRYFVAIESIASAGRSRLIGRSQ